MTPAGRPEVNPDYNPASNPAVDRVAIAWEDARAANLANWNDRAALHVQSYGLDALRDDPEAMTQVVSYDLPRLVAHVPGGTLSGMDVCHLQCHIGTDTASLARAGARLVVGVDFSRPALDSARALADELGLAAEWVETDVLEARAAIDAQLGADRRFDVVYTSIGTVGWLHDIRQWARQVAALLKPGGTFYIRDGHPMLYTIDDLRDEPVVRYRYFGDDGTALASDEERTYIGDGRVEHTRSYEYPHTIADVVNALLESGLEVVWMSEDRELPWRHSARMVQRPDGDFEWPGDEADLVPCTFTVVARAPRA